MEIGGFDKIIEYGIEDLDEVFKNKNSHILIENRLAGYGIWKPYIVLNTLEKQSDGDYVFYCDSGSYWVGPVSYLVDELDSMGGWLLTFQGYSEPLPLEKFWTKRDCFILMDCDSPKYTDTVQGYDGFFLIKNCREARDFFIQWCKYAVDERISTDKENECGLSNYEGFKDHRHDQSIMSLLVKKWDIKMCDLLPDQYRPVGDNRYPQLINHTRDPK